MFANIKKSSVFRHILFVSLSSKLPKRKTRSSVSFLFTGDIINLKWFSEADPVQLRVSKQKRHGVANFAKRNSSKQGAEGTSLRETHGDHATGAGEPQAIPTAKMGGIYGRGE